MAFLTARQRATALSVAVLVAVAVATAITGDARWSLAAAAILLGILVMFQLDLRHRLRVESRALRRLAERVEVTGTSTNRELAGIRTLAEESAAALGELTAAAEARHTETVQRLAHLDYEPVNEVQALLQLVPKVADAPPLPAAGGWALSASSLLGIWGVVERERPAVIVECGSGTSTMWLGYAARSVGGIRVVALEHKAAFARQTADLLAEHGLQDVAEVRHAPLHEVVVDGETRRWYDEGRIADLTTIDLLLVDGPPKSVGALARFPAVPVLKDKLADGAAVVVDDVGRADEQEAVSRWSERHDVVVERRLSRDALLLRHAPPAPTEA